MSADPTRSLEERRSTGPWQSKHVSILKAAMEEFIERGFNGASMDRIAVKAKVSKVTIYNHFEKKDVLYRDTIAYYVDHLHPKTPAVEATAGAQPRDVLMRYLTDVVTAVAGELTIGMIRLLRADPKGGESRLLPDPRPITGYLAGEGQSGRLRVRKPEMAARQLLGMLFENTLYPSLNGETVELSAPVVGEVVEACVDTFLAHYGVSA